MIWSSSALQWLGETIKAFGRLQLMGGSDEADVSEAVVGYNTCGATDARSVGKRKFLSTKAAAAMETA